jgi:UDP:flavonoid glycosyltransferase YjiC (YdhE family)
MTDSTTQAAPPRVLFVAEAVTLAHVARPRVLAEGLDPRRYEVHFATAPAFDTALTGLAARRWPLTSIPPERFLKSLSQGTPLYDTSTLTEYVEQDLALLDQVRPDLVIGDFRLSLAISAPLRQVPYAALTNAHWSPFAQLPRWPIPDLPAVRIVGERLAASVFNRLRPAIFRLHGRPLNRARRRFGLPPVGNMLQAYTWGDHTLYLDVPELIPTRPLPANHRFIGPIVWEPATAPPVWWGQVPASRPCVYLTLGSSGPARLLPDLIRALAELPMTLMVATAGRVDLSELSPNVLAAHYLPGRAAAERADLVICNGGSGTVYQALSQGTPVLGIPTNLDQHLTMHFVAATGAGCILRSDAVTRDALRQRVADMLAGGAQAAAGRVQGWFRAHPAVEGFNRFLHEQLPTY